MEITQDSKIITSFKKTDLVFSLFIILIGVLALIGWQFDIDLAKNFYPGSIFMNPLTALCFILIGLSIQVVEHKIGKFIRFAQFTGLLIILVGFLRLETFIFGFDSQIDQLIFRSKLLGNTIAPNTALAFIITGISLSLLAKNKYYKLIHALCVFNSTISLLAILGYFYSVKNLYGFPQLTPMALNTAIAFLLTSLSILLINPNKSFMKMFSSDSLGSKTARILFPTIIIIPPVLGKMILFIQNSGFFKVEFGYAIFNILLTNTYLIIIYFIVIKINKIEFIQKKAKETISTRNKELENATMATQNALKNLAKENEKSKVIIQDLEKFKLAVDNASDQIIITDKDAIVLYLNGATEKITGYSREELMGKKAGKLWGGLMERSFYENLWKTIKIDKKTFVGIVINQNKNAKKYTAEINISPILDEKDEVKFFVGIERDITREKELEKEKEKQLEHELEIELKEKDFISMASHQLLTPLALMKGYTSMLISGKLGKIDKEAKKYLEESLQGSDRMSNLVKSLLVTSRIEGGKIKTVGVNFDLDKLMREVTTELKPKLEHKKLTIEVPTPKKLMVFADKEQTKEVLMNVIDNAIKYTKKGTITITENQTDGMGNVNIKDTGLGISQKDLPHIFEKFYSSENWLETQSESNGLGLYIAELLLKQMGGSIKVKSKIKEGSTFNVALPLSKNV